MKTNRFPIRLAMVAGVAAVVMAGILILGQGADAADSPDDGAVPTTPDTPNTAAGGIQPDGEHIVGRIIAAYVGPNELVYRPVELLVGEEAAEAAEADGAEVLDFYVREGSGQVSLPVDGDVTVTAVDCNGGCAEGAPSDYDTLTRTADGTGLHRLTVRDGVVVSIDAIYVS